MRMLGLERLELIEQAIVLGIGHARLVEYVVAVIVLVQLGAQFVDSGFGGHFQVLL